MNPYQPPSADVGSKPKRTFATMIIGLGCICFGGFIFLSSIAQLLGTGSVAHQNAAEAMGGKIASLLLAVGSAYLVLYGWRTLSRPRGRPSA
jgi:hypothetical protein